MRLVLTNFFGTTNLQNLRFYTNNTQKAVLTTDGFMGIGTTSPVSKLSVESNSDGNGEVDGRVIVDVKNTSTSTGSSAVVRITSGNTPNFTALSHIAPSYAFSPEPDNGQLWSSGAGGLVLRASPKSGNDADLGGIRFMTGWVSNPTGTIERMRLDKVGNLGIGTTAPTAKLSIETNSDGFFSSGPDGRILADLKNTSTSTASQSIVRMTAGNGGNFLNLGYTASTYSVGTDTDAGILWSTGTGGLVLRASPKSGNDPDVGAVRFYTGWNPNALNATFERMRLDKLGNLGIGTTAPNAKLHIVGDDNGTGSGQTDGRFFLRLNNQSTGNGSQSGIQFFAGGTSNETTIGHVSPTYSVVNGFGDFGQFRSSGAGIVLQAGNANGKIRFQSGGVVDKMVINANGNVGVGTSTPRSKVEVASGDVYLTDPTKGIILTSPNGNCWRVTIDNTGNMVRTQITCPQ